MFLIPSIRMRCIISPTSCPHHCHCQTQQNPWIKALVYTYLAWRNNFYQRRHWYIATGSDLLNSRCHQAPCCQQDPRCNPATLPLLSSHPKTFLKKYWFLFFLPRPIFLIQLCLPQLPAPTPHSFLIAIKRLHTVYPGQVATPYMKLTPSQTLHHPLHSTNFEHQRIYQNNSSECTQSHRHFIFKSPSMLQCTRCIKMHLLCFFQYSDESYTACSNYFVNSTHPSILLINFFSEQGYCKDLLTRRDGPVPQDPNNRIIINSTKMRSLVSTFGFSTNLISDRVHCNPLSLLASRSRCHTGE